jgi:uncharacterized protein YoxC
MNMLHIGAWIFGIVFLFALIGVYAVIHWIVNALRKTETAIEGGVHNVQAKLHHDDS